MIPKAYSVVLDEHRARLHRLTNRSSLPRLKSLYDEAHAELSRKLKGTLRPQLKQTFTMHQHRIMLGQVMQGQAQLARAMRGEIGDLSKTAQTEAVRGVSSDIRRLEKHFNGAEVTLPIDEAARFSGVIDKRRTSLLKMHKTSTANYGVHLVKQMENQLSLSLATGESVGDTIERLTDTADLEWWQGERIARTELAWAYNASHADAIEETAKELPDLYMRWNELVDDDTGNPLDDRVAVDSLAIHGQIARPGEAFIMPASSPVADSKGRTEVPDALVGAQWQFPPNRPNDRATLSPWRPDWGIPGWRYVAGRRVPVGA